MSDYVINQTSLGASIGRVNLQTVEFDSLTLDTGEMIKPVTIAYETYGTLNESRSNAILICHALSGDAHAAGYYAGEDKPGWWETMIGPEKGFDTDRYFVICSNVIGGCKGSSGPISINPERGREYGLDFPVVTVADIYSHDDSYRIVGGYLRRANTSALHGEPPPGPAFITGVTVE